MVDVQTGERFEVVAVGEILQAYQAFGLLSEMVKRRKFLRRQRGDVRPLRWVPSFRLLGHEREQQHQRDHTSLAADVDPHHGTRRQARVIAVRLPQHLLHSTIWGDAACAT